MSQQEWIRQGYKLLGLSQMVLGEKHGVSQVQVSRWETGKAAPFPKPARKVEGRVYNPCW